MATFGLVHGTCDDPQAKFSDYAAVVEAALADADDVVLVGHSTGGQTIPLVAARRPVRELVYLFRRHVAPELDDEAAQQSIALLRPQFLTPFTERCPLDELPDVPRRYVLCREDHLVSPDYGRRVAPERLGVEPIEMPGGHCPMAWQPGELADLLMDGAAA